MIIIKIIFLYFIEIAHKFPLNGYPVSNSYFTKGKFYSAVFCVLSHSGPTKTRFSLRKSNVFVVIPRAVE